MSLKPRKMSEIKREQEKINAKMERRKKVILEKPPPYMYIISEGTKTEPNYIKGLVKIINAKYSDLSSGDRIVVEGTGRNTTSLLKYARRRVEKVFPQADIVWLMYDKDDFPLDNFDNTQFSAEGRCGKRKFKVAWSNESIELWFVLHFQELTANTGRERYIDILEELFEYRKNHENLYDLLKDKTNIAITRAKKQYESYDDLPPSQRCPATRVYDLIEELQKYL